MLESFAGGLGFLLYTNEKSMFLKDPMNGSPGTREVELVLDPAGSPYLIFFFESDYPLIQRTGYCSE